MIYPPETVVNKTVVKVLNTQASVTSGCLDLKDTFPCIGDGMVLAGAEGRRLLGGYSKARQVGGPAIGRSHLGAFEYSIMISG